MKYHRWFLGLLSSILCAVVWNGCARKADSAKQRVAEKTPRIFTDVAAEAGIHHRHSKPILDAKLSNIMSWMNTVGAAVAAADYDRDGSTDLYFTSSKKGEPNYLYRNNGDGSFSEVAVQAGLAAANDERGASMDAVWGDVDGDGWPDLYLVRWGSDSLYRNDGPDDRGQVTFTEVTDRLFRRRDGSPGIDWANGNAAIFFDYDLDGRTDIYVGNYFPEVDLWNLETTRIMHDDFERARNAGRNYLYQQQADGTFREVAGELGVDDSGWTLAVGAGDLNNDGRPDLYCADDFGPDQLFLGQPGGRFVNVSDTAIGFDTKKGMNADFGDFNNDGWLDVYVTNITTAEYLQEGNMLWYNQGLDPEGRLRFTDISLETGTYDGGWGWGAKFFDYDNDGDQDIVAANGFISAGEGSYWYDLASWTVLGEDAADAANWPAIGDRSFSGYERERLWRNDGFNTFTEESSAAGLITDRDGRGIAVLDVDNDGDLDVAIANQGQPPHLFRNLVNDNGRGRHWLLVDLAVDPATGVNRDGIGTRVSLQIGDRLQVRELDGGNGYSGQSDRRLHFGLGDAESVDLMEIRWPDGGRQYLEAVAVDQILEVRQDPSRYSDVSAIELGAPEDLAAREAVEAVPEIDPGELERQLAELEEHLSEGFERLAASAYRARAATYGQHDRAIAFLERRAEATGDPDWRVELSLAFVDKIPTCGGVAAIVCKGSLAKKGLDQADLALVAEPDSWLGFYARGMNHLHWPRALRHSDDAAEDLERCVELKRARGEPRPYEQRVYVALGQAYAKAGRSDEARSAWRRGLEHFPDSEEIQEHLAVDDDGELLALVQDKRSLERSIDTDISFYQEE